MSGRSTENGRRGEKIVKCWKCHTTMIKDEYSRTATCPCCGRTVHYRTKSEKKWSSSFSDSSGGYSSSGSGCSGCASVLGVGALVIMGIPLLLLSLIFGDGFWSFLGGAVSFLFNLLWTIIEFVFKAIWWLISGLFDLIF